MDQKSSNYIPCQASSQSVVQTHPDQNHIQTQQQNSVNSHQMIQAPSPQQVFANSKGPMRVCLKRADGTMVEQTHLRVSQSRDGKFVINSNQNQPGQWMQSNGTPIRAILIDNKQGGPSLQLPPTARIVSPSSTAPNMTSGGVQGASPVVVQRGSCQSSGVQKIAPKTNQGHGKKIQIPEHRPSVDHNTLHQSPSIRPRPMMLPSNHGFQDQQLQRPDYSIPPQQQPPVIQAATGIHETDYKSTLAPIRLEPTEVPAQRINQYLNKSNTQQPNASNVHSRAAATSASNGNRGGTMTTTSTPHGSRGGTMATTSTPHGNRGGSMTTGTTPARSSGNAPSARWNNNSVLNGISTMSNGGGGGGSGGGAVSRKRASPVQFDVKPTPPTDRKRPRCSSERGGKGLRHFSSKVCEKVKSKGVTTYLEVSEELVEEFSQQSVLMASGVNGCTPSPSITQSFDVKNIRRRVYDALNVLCAMNIISKDKKEIRWIGLPTNSVQECRQLEKYKTELQQRIKDKKKKAQEFMLQLVAYKTLIQRNRKMEDKMGKPLPENATIQVPFIILSTGANTQIGLEVADDKTEYEFTFNEIFEIHDEIGILKKMGFCYGLDTGDYTTEGLTEAMKLLPKSAKKFLEELFPKKTEGEGSKEEDTKPTTSEPLVEIVKHPQQISVKHEPQELSEVEKQALETYSFDGPIYSSGYPDYNNGEQPKVEDNPGASTSDKSRDAANTLLSLTTVS